MFIEALDIGSLKLVLKDKDKEVDLIG